MLGYKDAAIIDYDELEADDIRKVMTDSSLPHKERLLEYMKSFPDFAAAAGRVNDVISGKYTNITILAYTDGGYGWTNEDIYYLEKYNVPLRDEFIEHILSSNK